MARAGAAFLIGVAAISAPAEVRLELRVPPAETYVIGDVIPLHWRFRNEGSEALGFMWEGCCRLNGKLDVRASDGALATFPPGQALAHMFARADRLDPGVPRDYETKVADWVALPGTGTYELRGTYRGVLPTQFPQIQRGLALWRDAAVSSPVTVSVVSVADYLASREARSVARGLRVSLDGPPRLPPLGPVSFRVRFENLRAAPRTIAWPDEVALWTLNERDERVAAAAVIGGTTEAVTLPARGEVTREFVVGADRFEGEPFGSYRLFVDVAAGGSGAGEPRVPSGLSPLAWHLDRSQVADLLQQAAKGAGAGARNAPLKLLRVYLAELGPQLAEVRRSGLSPEAERLADRLARAAQLKPLAPKPGTVELGFAVPVAGEPVWVDSRPREALADAVGGWDGQVSELLSLRRHLGWEVALGVEPADAVSVGRLRSVGDRLKAVEGELAGPLSIRLPTGGTNAPARLSLDAGAASTGPCLRLRAGGREWSEDGVRFESVADDAGLARRAGAVAGSGAVPIRVEVPDVMTWGEVRRALEPVLRPGGRLSLGPKTGP